MTENEHKNMPGNIPEMLVIKWTWRKDRKQKKQHDGFALSANIIIQLSL